MNRYGNKCGVHTPERTELNKTNLQLLTGIEFDDTSWHNDLCDSVGNEELNIQVFFPNSDRQNEDEEEFNTYSIVAYDGESICQEYESKLYSFEGIVNIIGNIINK